MQSKEKRPPPQCSIDWWPAPARSDEALTVGPAPVHALPLGPFDHLLRWWGYRSSRRSLAEKHIADRGVRYLAVLRYLLVCCLLAAGWLAHIDEWLKERITEYTIFGNIIVSSPYPSQLPEPPVLIFVFALSLVALVLSLHIRTASRYYYFSLLLSLGGLIGAPLIFIVELLIIYPFCWLPIFGESQLKNFCVNEHQILWAYPTLTYVYANFLLTLIFLARTAYTSVGLPLVYKLGPLPLLLTSSIRVVDAARIETSDALQRVLRRPLLKSLPPDSRVLRHAFLSLASLEKGGLDFDLGFQLSGEAREHIKAVLANSDRPLPVFGFAQFRLRSWAQGVLDAAKSIFGCSRSSGDAGNAYFLGEIDAYSGEPAGFGTWVDGRGAGETLVGFWRAGLPAAPYETVCGDSRHFVFVAAKMLVAHGRSAAAVAGTAATPAAAAVLHAAAAQEPPALALTLAEVELCASGAPVDGYPLVLRLERCRGPGPAAVERRPSVDIELALADRVRSPFAHTSSPSPMRSPLLASAGTTAPSSAGEDPLPQNGSGLGDPYWTWYAECRARRLAVVRIEELRRQLRAAAAPRPAPSLENRSTGGRIVLVVPPVEWNYHEAVRECASLMAGLDSLLDDATVTIVSSRRPVGPGPRLARRIIAPCCRAEVGAAVGPELLAELLSGALGPEAAAVRCAEVHAVALGSGVRRLVAALDQVRDADRVSLETVCLVVPVLQGSEPLAAQLQRLRAATRSSVNIYAVNQDGFLTETSNPLIRGADFDCSPHWHVTAQDAHGAGGRGGSWGASAGGDAAAPADDDLSPLAAAMRDFRARPSSGKESGVPAAAMTVIDVSAAIRHPEATGAAGALAGDKGGAQLGPCSQCVAGTIGCASNALAPRFVSAERAVCRSSLVAADLRTVIMTRRRELDSAAASGQPLHKLCDGVWAFQSSAVPQLSD